MSQTPEPDWLTAHREGKKRRHGFQPGQSGNPKGRPKGSKNRKTLIAEEFEKQGGELARVVMGKALEGDMQAASLVLTRLAPPLRVRAEKVQFELDPEAPIADQATSVVSAMARGEIDPDTAKLILDMLSALVGLRDVETFLRALRETERPSIPGGVVALEARQ